MSKIKYNAIIIGCGKIAGKFESLKSKKIYSHAQAYKRNSKIHLTAVVDSNFENVKSFAEKYKVKNYYTNLKQALLVSDPHVISVCTPDHTHYSICLEILTIVNMKMKLKVIFLEKPCCQNEIELNYLIKLAKRKNIAIIVNHSRRFEEKHLQLKYLISKNKFGKLVHANILYYSGLMHNGIHAIDTFRFLTNDELIPKQLIKKYPSAYKNDFTINAILECKSSKAQVVLQSISEDYYQLFEFDLMFEKARIRIDDFGNIISIYNKFKNQENENVIPSLADINLKSKSNPIDNAIIQIVNLLDDKINKNIESNIINIKNSMQTIWRIQNEFKSKS